MQQLFSQVVNQFQSQHQYDKFIKESQKEYDIKIYRLHTFSRQYALQIYNQLQMKYGSDEMKQLPQGWHENQRRLYVWFIVCFIHLKMLEPNKLVDGEKYWKNIGLIFWQKDIPFLKYQLLTLLKTRGRTNWKNKEDRLLKEAYQQFQKGQWNQVAKYCYFNSRGEFFKTPKQCRQRWQNHLNDQIIKGQWSKEEDRTILEYVKRNGAHWASIVPLLNHSRTEHMIKNRYKSVINKLMQDKLLNEGQAVLEALRSLDFCEIKYSEENNSKRDDHGILLVQSEEYIDEEQEPPVIERKKRKEKKRGRPKKVQPEVKPGDSKILGIERRTQNRGIQLSRDLTINNNHSNCLIEGNVSLGNKQIIENYSNFSNLFGGSNNNRSHQQFFNSSRLSFRSNGFGYPAVEEDKNSLFMGHNSSRLRSREGFEPILLDGQSLFCTRRLSVKNQNDSLISGFMQ